METPEGTPGYSPTAARAVRLQFNPSQDSRVQRIKCLTAALVTEMEQVAAEAMRMPEGAQAEQTAAEMLDCSGRAIDHVVTANMHCVLAATAHL